MDLPNEIVEAVQAVAPDAPPARATRSAQRRRAAKTYRAPAPARVETFEADLLAAESPVAETPAIEQATDEEPVVNQAVIEQPTASEPGPIEAEPTLPVPFNPPAAVMADTTAEEQTMDTIDTAATTANDAAEQFAGRGQAAFADMNGRAKEALEKTTRMAEELGSFGKGNLEAMVESSKIAAKGFETLGQEAAEFTRKSFENATAVMKTLAATRSPTEFMKLQSDYARSMFDTMVAETSKSTEMMLKLANDVAQPLSNRVALAAEKMKVAA